MTDKEFGQLLREKREELKKRQKDVGKALGYSGETAQTIVAGWESGQRKVPRKYIKTLSDILGIPIEYFL